MYADVRIRLTSLFLFVLTIASFTGSKAAIDSESFRREFHWQFEGCEYQLGLSIPWETYHFYQEKPRVYHNYAVYTYEHAEWRFLPYLVQELECLAEASGMDRKKTLSFVVAFVQQLEYRNDRGEYPKWPVETIAERGGDCEDTSILLSAMLRAMGYETLLINPPGHMAVAVACEDCEGAAYRVGEKDYYYVETTASGFEIGEVPEDYRGGRDKLMASEARPVDLWVLRAFHPKSQLGGQLVYFVSEDACTQVASSQRGDLYMARTTLKRVMLNGRLSTSRSVELR